jgi:DNA-binding MarR family transcriptional regulator
MTVTKTRAESRQVALERLGAAFKGVMAGTRRLRGRETQRPGELSFAQFHLLFGLAGEGELSTTGLAARADLSPATATQMLDGLEAMGLVERTRSAQDRRVVMCSLTDRGQVVTAEKRADWEARWKNAMSEFTIDELATATAVLERLRHLFEEIDEG